MTIHINKIEKFECSKCLKGGLILASVLAAFALLHFLTLPAEAVTFECASSTTLVEITQTEEDCPDCPPLPDCPPVLACAPGYSCQLDPIEPPPITGFFMPYINPQRDKLPANRIYPIGQRMMISWYNPTTPAEINSLAAHGFSAAGPWENAWGVGFDLDAVVARVKDKGMRSWLFMHMGKSPNGKPLMAVYGVCDALANGITPQEIGARANRLKVKYSAGDYAATVDARMHFPEEMSQRLDRCDKSKLLAVNNAVTDNLKQHIPITPLIKSETNNNSLTNANFNAVNGRLSAPVRQYYFSGHTDLDILPYYLNTYAELVNNLKANTTADRPNIDKRVLGVIGDWTSDPASGDANRYTDYYMTTALIKGVQSFSFAHYAHLENPPHSPSQKLKNAWFDSVQKITSCGIDDAMLWGTDNPPGGSLTITRTSGPSKSVKYNQPTMLVAERQYGSSRYVLLTNSHKSDSITVRISGLPESYKLHDCKTGNVSIMTGDKTVTLQAWGSVMYKINK